MSGTFDISLGSLQPGYHAGKDNNQKLQPPMSVSDFTPLRMHILVLRPSGNIVPKHFTSHWSKNGVLYAAAVQLDGIAKTTRYSLTSRNSGSTSAEGATFFSQLVGIVSMIVLGITGVILFSLCWDTAKVRQRRMKKRRNGKVTGNKIDYSDKKLIVIDCSRHRLGISGSPDII